MLHEEILNSELVSMVKKHFDVEQISGEFKDNIFGKLKTTDSKNYGKYYIEFKIENLEQKDDLYVSNLKDGNIFELVGTNQRFKTTSLIIMAIIFLYDFEGAEEIISSNQLMSRVSELQKIIFSCNNTRIYFSIKNSDYNFHFEKSENKVILGFLDDSKEIELSHRELSNQKYDEYKELIKDLNLADVQFVSKGRNFVGYVHKQIREEFLMTLNIIKRGLEKTVTEFMDLPTNYQTTKSETEVKNEIVYAKKSIEILNNLKYPIPDLNSLIIFSKGEYANIPNGILREREKDLYEEINKLARNHRGIETQKNKILEELEKMVNEIDVLAEGMPYNFNINNLEYTLDQINNQWEYIYTNEMKKEIVRADKDESLSLSVVPFTTSSSFFRNIRVQTVQDLNDLFEEFSKSQMKMIELKEYIYNNEERIREMLKQLSVVNREIAMISMKEKEINDDKEDITHMLSLIGRYTTEEDKTLNNILSISEVAKEIQSFKLLSQFLDKVNFIYQNEEQEILHRKLSNHIENLNIILTKSKKSIALPKKIKDIEFMGKFIQDLTAVIGYLSMDDRDYNETIANASMKTNVHDEIINLFNDYMTQRCKYYFEVKSPSSVAVHKLLDYDYENKQFQIEGRKVSTSEGISGGTDSAMTVRSFASQKTKSKFGVFMLVDEWGDVGPELASKVYDTIVELESYGVGIFVKVENKVDEVVLRYMR